MSQPLRVAGFELITSGRFWVIAKVIAECSKEIGYCIRTLVSGDRSPGTEPKNVRQLLLAQAAFSAKCSKVGGVLVRSHEYSKELFLFDGALSVATKKYGSRWHFMRGEGSPRHRALGFPQDGEDEAIIIQLSRRSRCGFALNTFWNIMLHRSGIGRYGGSAILESDTITVGFLRWLHPATHTRSILAYSSHPCRRTGAKRCAIFWMGIVK